MLSVSSDIGIYYETSLFLYAQKRGQVLEQITYVLMFSAQQLLNVRAVLIPDTDTYLFHNYL